VITSKRIFAATLAGVCLALAGCGDDDEGAPIPADTAVALQSELDGVQGRLNEGSAGACRDILEGPRGPNIDRVRELLNSMPDDVDPDVRSALEDSFDRLWELVQQECDEKAEREQAEPEPEPEPEPEETETETVPPETETEPVPPPEEELPPEGDGDNDGEVPPGNGNGVGNGVGNGGGVGPGSVGGDG
jgi:hypothetical protein